MMEQQTQLHRICTVYKPGCEMRCSEWNGEIGDSKTPIAILCKKNPPCPNSLEATITVTINKQKD